jgi:RimJ/RimL family protein N-acetyltransferase
MTGSFAPVPTLHGEIVRLRPLGAHDVDALFALHSDERVMRYWSFRPWTRREQAFEHIARLARERTQLESYPWAVTLPDNDELIGTCSLFGIHRERRRGVIGYALEPKHWGCGVASPMVGAALDFAFDVLALDRMEADIHPLNIASRRRAERAGFRRETPMGACARPDDATHDTVLYSLLREDRCGLRNPDVQPSAQSA